MLISYRKCIQVIVLLNKISFHFVFIFKQFCDVSIAKYNINTIENKLFSKLKYETPPPHRYNLVYKINCTECEGTYIAQTSHWIKTSIGQRKNVIKQDKHNSALLNMLLILIIPLISIILVFLFWLFLLFPVPKLHDAVWF